MKKSKLLVAAASILALVACGPTETPTSSVTPTSSSEVESGTTSTTSNTSNVSSESSELSSSSSESSSPVVSTNTSNGTTEISSSAGTFVVPEFTGFPFDSLRQYFMTFDVPPAFQADNPTTYVEGEPADGSAVYIVGAPVGTYANNVWYTDYLEYLGYIDIEQMEDEFGIYYYASSETLPFSVLFYEMDNEGVDYFYVEYGHDIATEQETPQSSVFPQSEIGSFFGTSDQVPGYTSDLYYYFFDDTTYTVPLAFVWSTISATACNSVYRPQLEGLGYTITEDTDAEVGPYYVAESTIYPFEIIFYEDSSDNTFNLQIAYYGDQADNPEPSYSSWNDVMLELQDAYNYATDATTTAVLPEVVASAYEVDDYSSMGWGFIIYADVATDVTASYIEALKAAGFIVADTPDENGYYTTYSETSPYTLEIYYDADYGFILLVDFKYPLVLDDYTQGTYPTAEVICEELLIDEVGPFPTLSVSSAYTLATTDSEGDYVYCIAIADSGKQYSALFASQLEAAGFYSEQLLTAAYGYVTISISDYYYIQTYYDGHYFCIDVWSAYSPSADIPEDYFLSLNGSNVGTSYDYNGTSVTVDGITFTYVAMMQYSSDNTIIQVRGTKDEKAAASIKNDTAIEGLTGITFAFSATAVADFAMTLEAWTTEDTTPVTIEPTTEVAPTADNEGILSYDLTGYEFFSWTVTGRNASYLTGIYLYRA